MDWQGYAVHIIFYLAVALVMYKGFKAFKEKGSQEGCPGCDGSCGLKGDHGKS
jgi:hypothetical protein